MSVVDAVAIEAVLVASSECSDHARAEAMLATSLAPSRGPRHSTEKDAHWRLTMSVTVAAPGIKSADAQIQDDRGRVVAERTVSDRTTGSCVALARAVGAWAQIVLDDELVREHEDAERRERESSLPPPETRPIRTTSTSVPNDADADAGSLTPTDRAPPEGRTFEIGTMLFLRNGAAATGGMFGVSPFVTVSFAEKWVVRPSFMYGTSTSRVPPDESNSENLSSMGGRLDVCRRMPGNYLDHRGMEFDACLGGDAVSVWSGRDSTVRGTLGPSVVLRGEIGHGFGLEIRTMVGVNLSRARFMDSEELAPFVAAAELGASVRFR
ncbi:MAG: hypothetical protein K0S65_5512 [Labilithrix sp.]|nr:hypothetical protein [Labilithrix sp.]